MRIQEIANEKKQEKIMQKFLQKRKRDEQK